jgi:hypothetical protein
MASAEKISTHQKALGINLDLTTYGSFAEIGAGQEVVRWFLVVGGASGTVAKSISAYDKEVSDDLYGSGNRYVSKERLEAMLNSEWTQLVHQLSKSRGSKARFFSFVDTISARNYAGMRTRSLCSHVLGRARAVGCGYSCTEGVGPGYRFVEYRWRQNGPESKLHSHRWNTDRRGYSAYAAAVP